MKRLMAILIILSLLMLGCSTEVVEEQSVEEQIDEAQAIVEEAMKETEIIPPIDETEVVEEPTKIVETEDLEDVVIEDVEVNLEESIGTTHLVQIKVTGFEPNTITIKAGDSIQWENVRSGNLNKAMIVGSSPCTEAKSTILMPGETYTWTFNDPVKCAFTDAITITQLMKVIVE